MRALIGPRLSVMMFLQFFLWGAWYVTAAKFLGTIGFQGPDIGWTYSVGPLAGILSPFFVGMIADRFFPTERMLGVMHFLAAAAMVGATVLMRSSSPSPSAINLLLFVHMLCYFPTLALTNSLAMHTMTDSEKQFPMIRVFGTIGWIVAGLVLGWRKWDFSINMFYLAAAAGVVQAVYSFTLPHTPPPGAGKRVTTRELLGLDALGLLKQRSFAIFMISSFLICIPLAFYYQLAERAVTQAGLANPPIKMTFGQGSEIFFMVAMPFFFARLGVKWMLLVGMAAWVARYVLFAVGSTDAVAWMMMTGILLHGICYDFFFVTGQIYTDKTAPSTIRAQAQGLLVLFTLGLGMMIGAQVAGAVEKRFTPPASEALSKDVTAISAQIAELEKTIPAGGAEADPKLAELRKLKEEKSLQALRLMDWKMIWSIPAAGAAIVMVLFALLFSESPRAGTEVTEGQVAADALYEGLR